MNDIEQNLLFIETLNMINNDESTEEEIQEQAFYINTLITNQELNNSFADLLFTAILKNEPNNNHIIFINNLNYLTETQKERLRLKAELYRVRRTNNEREQINFINSVISALETEEFYDIDIINATIILCYGLKQFTLLNTIYRLLKVIENYDLPQNND